MGSTPHCKSVLPCPSVAYENRAFYEMFRYLERGNSSVLASADRGYFKNACSLLRDERGSECRCFASHRIVFALNDASLFIIFHTESSR